MHKYICIFFLLLFLSCKKKKTVTDPVITVVTAQTGQMTISQVNAAEVDVDNNGTKDLKLLLESIKTGAGPQFGVQFQIQCLHDQIAFRAENSTVSVFSVHSQSVFAVDTGFIKRIDNISSCSASAGSEKISEKTELQLLRFDAGQLFSSNDQYQSGNFIIRDVGFNFQYISFNKDTTIISAFKTEACKNLLLGGDNYFCFKLTTNNKTRLGWIKLKGASPIVIEEIGITN